MEWRGAEGAPSARFFDGRRRPSRPNVLFAQQSRAKAALKSRHSLPPRGVTLPLPGGAPAGSHKNAKSDCQGHKGKIYLYLLLDGATQWVTAPHTVGAAAGTARTSMPAGSPITCCLGAAAASATAAVSGHCLAGSMFIHGTVFRGSP